MQRIVFILTCHTAASTSGPPSALNLSNFESQKYHPPIHRKKPPFLSSLGIKLNDSMTGNWSEDWGSCHSWVGANLHTPIPTHSWVSLVSCLHLPVCSNKHFPKEAAWCLRNIGRLGQSCALGRPPGIDGKPWTHGPYGHTGYYGVLKMIYLQ